MTKEAAINLKITSDGIKRFCTEIAVGSSNTQRKHAAFMALEAFITRHAGADAYTNSYNQIQQIVEEFSTETRSCLLTENAESLKAYLNRRYTTEIGRIFSSVSRNGFKQIFIATIEQMTTKELENIRLWIPNWCATAKMQAEQASGYPDAMDFHNTDVDLVEYTALAEINRLLANLDVKQHNIT